jgi:hypothetical protein
MAELRWMMFSGTPSRADRPALGKLAYRPIRKRD